MGRSGCSAPCLHDELGVEMDGLAFVLAASLLGCFSARGPADFRLPPSARNWSQAILSEGETQQKLLSELAESGSKIVA